MKDAGKSPKTIRNHHAIISSALHQAARWGWVRTNVAELAKPPRIAQRRVKAPSVDAVRVCHTGAAERDPRLAALFMLGAADRHEAWRALRTQVVRRGLRTRRA